MSEYAMQDAVNEIIEEYIKARAKHAPMHSGHEGYAVMLEELDELWEHVRADTGHTVAARHEAMQVAAMGLAYMLEVSRV